MRFVGLASLVTIVAGCVSAQAPDLDQGKRLFESQCALCHGQDGRGGRGPSLAHPKLKHAPDEESLRKVIETGIPNTEMPGAWQLHPREIISVAAYVRTIGTVAPEKLPGDPARGAAVYNEQGCAGCHIIEGQGSGFGPELSNIGARRSGAYLRQSLVKPGAAFPDSFLFVEATLRDGRRVRGIRANEDSFSIQVKDMSQAFHSFRKADLKDLRKLFDESPMPSYEKLSAAALDDLVAYLAGLRGKE